VTQFGVWVDRPQAGFASWYELFPRSTGGWNADGEPVHGTFATASKALPRNREHGFRRGVPAADSSDRQGPSQGPQTTR